MTHSLIIEEVLAHPQDISWLPWAVQYFFFIGIAACAALFACYLHWRKKDAATEENRALLIAITCAITAPLALTADLHQTARVWHFYAWPTPLVVDALGSVVPAAVYRISRSVVPGAADKTIIQ